MFWTDVEERVIVRSHLDGSNATLLVGSDLSFPGMYVVVKSVIVSSVHAQVYFCCHKEKWNIMLCNSVQLKYKVNGIVL